MVLDLSGRPGLEYHVPFTRPMIGAFDVDLTHEFFQGFVNHALVTIHEMLGKLNDLPVQ